MKNIISKIGNVLLVVVLVLVLLISAVMLISSFSPTGANIFGFHPMVVMSESMEDTILVGDMIIVQEVDTATVQVEDVITFFGNIDGEGEREIITHRVVEIVPQADGSVVYHTKGDNNDLVDQDPMNIFYQEPIKPADVIGTWTGIRIPNYKDMILYFVVIPVAIIFVWQLIVVIRMAMKVHQEKQLDMVQAEKDRVIAEYLAEQKAKEEAEAKAQADNPAADTADPPSEE
ncbi:MAG: signal peptidase I [Clostridia bacterium]|nr:signal peptidase I [Clostridia bacterium]